MALSDLFSAFTGAPVTNAARQQRDFLGGQQTLGAGVLDTARQQGISGLQDYGLAGLNYLGEGINTGRGDVSAYMPQAAGALTGYTTTAANALGGGIQGAAGALQTGTQDALSQLYGLGGQGLAALRGGTASAVGAYDPLDEIASRYGGRATTASDAIERALGLRGPEGSAQARMDFTASPAYNFNLEQGLDAINRARAARGELAGGNIDRDTQQYGSGLASREWGDYLNRLAQREGTYLPYEPGLASTAAGGRAGAYMTGAGREADLLSGMGARGADLVSSGSRSLADVLASGGARQADLFSSAGRSLADLYSGTGGRLSELAARGGASGGGLLSGIGSGIADLSGKLALGNTKLIGDISDDYANTFAQEANATMGGSKNLFNLLGEAAKFGTGQGWFGLKPMPTA